MCVRLCCSDPASSTVLAGEHIAITSHERHVDLGGVTELYADVMNQEAN